MPGEFSDTLPQTIWNTVKTAIDGATGTTVTYRLHDLWEPENGPSACQPGSYRMEMSGRETGQLQYIQGHLSVSWSLRVLLYRDRCQVTSANLWQDERAIVTAIYAATEPGTSSIPYTMRWVSSSMPKLRGADLVEQEIVWEATGERQLSP